MGGLDGILGQTSVAPDTVPGARNTAKIEVVPSQRFIPGRKAGEAQHIVISENSRGCEETD